jgi:hypothetical protein
MTGGWIEVAEHSLFEIRTTYPDLTGEKRNGIIMTTTRHHIRYSVRRFRTNCIVSNDFERTREFPNDLNEIRIISKYFKQIRVICAISSKFAPFRKPSSEFPH